MGVVFFRVRPVGLVKFFVDSYILVFLEDLY